MKKMFICLLSILLIFQASSLELRAMEFVDWGDGGGASLEPAGFVEMQGEKLEGDLLKITVKARDFSVPVLGFSYYLNYDPTKLDFLRYENGNFLELGGDPLYLVKEFQDKGEIVVGQTLKRNDSFPLGEGNLIVFYFQTKAKADGLKFFFSNTGVSTLDTVRQDIERVEWSNYVFGAEEGAKNIQVDVSSENGISGGWVWIMAVGAAFFASLLIYIFAKKLAWR